MPSAGLFHMQVLLVELLVSTRNFLTCRSEQFESVAEQRLTAMKYELLEVFEHDINLSNTNKVG